MDLRKLYSTDHLLADRNRDDVPDAVATVLLLGTGSSVADGAAAANLAARLGLEVCNLSLPLVAVESESAGSSGTTTILVGRGTALCRRLEAEGLLDWTGVEPGQGLVQLVPPGDGRGPVLFVGGREDAGTGAAAHFVAARLPFALGMGAEQVVLSRGGAPSAAAPEAPVLRVVVTQPAPAAGEARGAAPLLANLYAAGGLLADHDGDFLPDTNQCPLVLPAEGNPALWAAAANCAARLGLESTGLRFPVAIPDSAAAGGSAGRFVLFGRRNRLLHGASPPAGAGSWVGLVNGNVAAFGRDDDGDVLAARWLSERLPYLGEVRRGQPDLAGVEQGLQDFVAALSPGGQAAAALVALDDLLQQAGADPQAVRASLYLKHPDDRLPAVVAARMRQRLPQSGVDVHVQDMDSGEVVMRRTFDRGWEVDRFRSLFYDRILPALEADPPAEPLTFDIRLSEPPQIRQQVRNEVHRELRLRGIQAEVTVLCAHKQGYSWLQEVVAPRLKALGNVAQVLIRFQELKAPGGGTWVVLPVRWLQDAKPKEQRVYQNMYQALMQVEGGGDKRWVGFPIRWLQQLYPIDEVLSAELGIPLEAVDFAMAEVPHTYVVEARDAAGNVVFSQGLDVRYATRTYLDPYPEWGNVVVSTGGVTVRVGDRSLFDERIVTDGEAFWEEFQAALHEVNRWVLADSGGRPTRDRQPLFRELTVDAALSEANHQIGLREDFYSVLEGLHEDVYFAGLDFFFAVGNTHGDGDLEAPGQIVPWIHDTPGGPTRGSITLSAFASRSPRLVLQVTRRDGQQQVLERPLAGVAGTARVEGVAIQGAEATAVQVAVEGTAEGAETLTRRLAALALLHQGGAYRDTLAWAPLGSLQVTGAGRPPVVVPRPAELPDDALPPAAEPVPDNRIIDYELNESLLRRLDQTPGNTLWLAGHSFQGRKSWALDVVWPAEGLFSQAKASLWKPTYMLVNRHHANEVSATNAALKLAELCHAHPTYREYLKRVNLTIVPFENVDGAVLHYELQKEHPRWMHHAARYNACGLEFHSEYHKADTPFPEAKVRPRVWRTWLPDIVVDCHERPSHEWTQPFAGYTPVNFSYLWLLPSFFTGIMRYLDDPGYPHHPAVGKATRKAVVDAMNANPEIRRRNLEWAGRYWKYAHRWMPEKSPITYFEDVQFHFTPKEANPRDNDFMARYPHVTALSWTTEVAGETGQGSFLKLTTSAQLTANTAVLAMMAEASYQVLRRGEAVRGGWQVNLHRPRPILPAGNW